MANANDDHDGPVAEGEKCSYDVFLSFRGEDTRHTFTGHLYNALVQKGIITFMDNQELKAGKQIAPTLHKAIEESRSSVVVFSENYADSTWCLDELVKIHHCMLEKDQLVIPIFFKVEPSDVRHQKRSYGQAMAEHESRFGKDSEKVRTWRSTLFQIANLSGKQLKSDGGDEYSKLIQDLVNEIFIRVSPKDLASNEYIVGRENRVKELKSLLEIESRNITCMLGIHGTGGIGKTTLAKVLFDSIYKQFEGSCFLFNIRETANQFEGLRHLQKELLSNTLEDKKMESAGNDMIRRIKMRLGLKRVLIVLDDIDSIEQLNNLAGGCDWFGPGSRIIITTRDEHLLDVGMVEKRYKVNLLNDQNSLELFCDVAFKKNRPESNYKALISRALLCCKGLPLALKVLGSHMIGKDLDGWEDALDRYEKIPHPEVQRVLRISYESLPLNEKNIFLDVACFFNGEKLEYVERVLHACDFYSRDGIKTLVDKSLLTVDNNYLRMHDLIQDMGREIVKEEAWNEAGERSRLWFHEDVVQVLDNNNGSSKIQGIKLKPPQSIEIDCSDTVFEKMTNLRILIVDNTRFSNEPRYLPNNLRLLDWKNYPAPSLPPKFYPKKIGQFCLSKSPLLVLDKAFQTFEHLIYLDVSHCQFTKFPDVSGARNLRELKLDRCEKLVEVHESVGRLTKLVSLDVSGCTELKHFVPTLELPSLTYLSLNSCESLTHFPDIKVKMDKPLRVEVARTAIKELPESIQELTGLQCLDATRCMNLQQLPSSLFMLPNLVTLKIGGCYQLPESFRRFKGVGQTLKTLHFNNASLSDEDLHSIIHSFPNLEDLRVLWNNFQSLPTGIKESTSLTSLDVSHCTKLREIAGLPSSLQKIDARHCNSLTSEACDILWSQASKKTDRLEVKMPKSEIPKWFNHVSTKWFPAFRARGRFPMVALAFVFGEATGKASGGSPILWHALGLHLFIDDEHRQRRTLTLAENHVLLCDMRVLFNMEQEEEFGDHWRTIRVYCETKLALCSWGVYVYMHEEEDIQFMSPDFKSSLVWNGSLFSITKISAFNVAEGYLLFQLLEDQKQMSPEQEQVKEAFQVLLENLSLHAIMCTRQGEEEGTNVEDENLTKEMSAIFEGLADITSGSGDGMSVDNISTLLRGTGTHLRRLRA